MLVLLFGRLTASWLGVEAPFIAVIVIVAANMLLLRFEPTYNQVVSHKRYACDHNQSNAEVEKRKKEKACKDWD